MPGYRRSYKRKWIPYERYKAMQRYKRTGRGSPYTARSYARKSYARKSYGGRRSYGRSRIGYVKRQHSWHQPKAYTHTGTKTDRSPSAQSLNDRPLFYKAGHALGTLGKYYSYFDPVIGGTMSAAGKYVTNVYDGRKTEPAAAISNFEKLYTHFLG